MKKLVLGAVIVFAVGLLAGCQSSKDNTGFDNADTASFDAASDTDATDIGNPPVPPEPVENQ